MTREYGTKDALLAALVAEAQQRVGPPQAPSPGLGRMRQRVARYIDQISAGDEHARAFLLLWAAVLRGASLHMIIRDAAPDSTAPVREAVLASLQRSLEP